MSNCKLIRSCKKKPKITKSNKTKINVKKNTKTKTYAQKKIKTKKNTQKMQVLGLVSKATQVVSAESTGTTPTYVF